MVIAKYVSGKTHYLLVFGEFISIDKGHSSSSRTYSVSGPPGCCVTCTRHHCDGSALLKPYLSNISRTTAPAQSLTDNKSVL